MDELQKYLGWPLEEVKAALGGQYTLRVKLTMPQRIRHYDARLKDLRVLRLRALDAQGTQRAVVEIIAGAFAYAPAACAKME